MEADACLLQLSKQTQPLCSHVADIAQCSLVGKPRNSVQMLSAFLSAARRYIADVQSATSLLRDPSRSEVMLWDFSKPQSVAQWDCVSDEEMGGQSEASFQGSDKGARPVIEGEGGSDVHVCGRPPPIQGMPPSLVPSPPSSPQEGTCCTAAMQPSDQGQQRCMCTHCMTSL